MGSSVTNCGTSDVNVEARATDATGASGTWQLTDYPRGNPIENLCEVGPNRFAAAIGLMTTATSAEGGIYLTTQDQVLVDPADELTPFVFPAAAAADAYIQVAMPCVGSVGLGQPMTTDLTLDGGRAVRKERTMRKYLVATVALAVVALAASASPAFTADPSPTGTLTVTVTAQAPAAPCVEFATGPGDARDAVEFGTLAFSTPAAASLLRWSDTNIAEAVNCGTAAEKLLTSTERTRPETRVEDRRSPTPGTLDLCRVLEPVLPVHRIGWPTESRRCT